MKSGLSFARWPRPRRGRISNVVHGPGLHPGLFKLVPSGHRVTAPPAAWHRSSRFGCAAHPRGKARNPKPDGRSPKEARNPNPKSEVTNGRSPYRVLTRLFQNLEFGLRASEFGIRPSGC